METLANMNWLDVCELREDEMMKIDGGGGLESFVLYLAGCIAYDVGKYCLQNPKKAKESFMSGVKDAGESPGGENASREYYTRQYLNS